MRSLGPSFEPRIGLAESDLLMGLNRQGQLSEIVWVVTTSNHSIWFLSSQFRCPSLLQQQIAALSSDDSVCKDLYLRRL